MKEFQLRTSYGSEVRCCLEIIPKGILEALVGLGVINPPHRRVASGFVMIDICRMNRDKIAEYSW